MRKKLKSKRGITLIALVVTIIVLIILAGVSISLVLGDNGIITKAKQSKKDTEEATIKEEVEMILEEIYIDKEKVELDDIVTWIGEKKPDIQIQDNRPDVDTLDLFYKDYIVTISDDAEIIEITKTKFKINIEKELVNYTLTVRASVTSEKEELTITKIKVEEQEKEGNEATFEILYPRNI